MPRPPLALALVVLAGCATTRTSPNSSLLTPGDPRLDLEAVTRPGSWTQDVYTEQDGTRERLGSRSDAIRRTADGGVVRVTTFETARGLLTDSLTADAALSPRSHDSENPRRVVALRFGPRSVRGTYSEAGSDPVRIDDAIPEPAFDSGLVDLVARAVPLDPGFEAGVRTYERASADAAETVVVYTVRVLARQVVGGREAAVVELSQGGSGATRFYLDPSTRDVVHMEFDAAPGVLMVMEPS